MVQPASQSFCCMAHLSVWTIGANMLAADIWKAETQSREVHVKMDDVTFLSFLDFFTRQTESEFSQFEVKELDTCLGGGHI